MNGERNPILSLPSVKALLALPVESRLAIAALLSDLANDADARAEESWRKRKGPMAAYWRATCTYAKHITRALGGRVRRAKESP